MGWCVALLADRNLTFELAQVVETSEKNTTILRSGSTTSNCGSQQLNVNYSGSRVQNREIKTMKGTPHALSNHSSTPQSLMFALEDNLDHPPRALPVHLPRALPEHPPHALSVHSPCVLPNNPTLPCSPWRTIWTTHVELSPFTPPLFLGGCLRPFPSCSSCPFLGRTPIISCSPERTIRITPLVHSLMSARPLPHVCLVGRQTTSSCFPGRVPDHSLMFAWEDARPLPHVRLGGCPTTPSCLPGRMPRLLMFSRPLLFSLEASDYSFVPHLEDTDHS